MPLTLHELKTYHDKAYTYSQVTRERAADDLVFYWISQWDDSFLSESTLQYRGEFNILRKAGRQILADLSTNQVQIDFTPLDDTRDDAADLADGIYRTSDNSNTSIEAYKNAKQETVVCGVGAWQLYTDYASNKSDSQNQVVKRMPIPEANNTVFWDPNARLLDKSDACYVSILRAYSVDGYKKLVNDLTGEDIDDINISNFKSPEQSYKFPWASDDKIYVAEFYHRKKVKDKILTMADPFGETISVRESKLKDVMDDMMDAGYEIVDEKKSEWWEVRKYIASGQEILNGEVKEDERTGEIIAGENIPVVPMYGERQYIEGEEHYEGITRLAKDPQRLRNFQMSYLADIVSKSPRAKPIFNPEQIAGFKGMYEEAGIDNDYPYLLMNRKDLNGEALPVGPVSVMPDTPVPQALVSSIMLSREAVEDVANPGIPQDIADPDLSGKAVNALTARLDMQSMHYQENYKHAKRRDAEIFISMAKEIYDVPRKVKLTMPDGTMKDADVLQTIFDKESGRRVVINDISNAEFDVYSKIGPSFSSQREQTVDRLLEMMPILEPGDPMKKAVQLKSLQLMDGVDFDDIREYARKQLIISGIQEPETDEEIQMLQAIQNQPQEPSAEMQLALAELEKAKADQMDAQTKAMDVQLRAQNEGMKRMIDKFEAMTDRMSVQVKAQKTGAEIDNTKTDTVGKELENASKIIELQKPKPINERSDEELFEMLRMG